MKWNQEFSVGIPEIDEQHKTLADCVTSIEQAVIGRERWLAVHSALQRAVDFARIHFAVEESLMRIHAYPMLGEHIVEHRQFSKNLERLQEKTLTADVSQEMISFIRGWLEIHVPTYDMPYAAHFFSNANGVKQVVAAKLGRPCSDGAPRVSSVLDGVLALQ